MLQFVKCVMKRILCVHDFNTQKDYNGDVLLECKKCGRIKRIVSVSVIPTSAIKFAERTTAHKTPLNTCYWWGFSFYYGVNHAK